MIVAFFIITGCIVVCISFTAKIDRSIASNFNAKGKLTPVSGGRVHWTVQGNGNGPSLICIHGLLGNSDNFYALTKHLEKTYTVYCVDRPGSGFSRRAPETSASFETQSAMLLEWMSKEGIDSAFLVGHSMGGGVALRMAIDAPNKIKSVSLLCPLTTPLKKGAGPLSMLYIPNEIVRNVLSKTIASPLRVKVGKKQTREIFSPEPVPPSFAIAGGGLLGIHSRSFYEGSKDTVSAQGSLFRQEKRYSEIRCPVGILYGEKDRILDPTQHSSAVTSKIPHAKSKLINNAGHMIPITQPLVCAEFINVINKSNALLND
ncbi:alpha/beta hydrolase [Alteromonas sp. V450]|uniref:alpha/beta fold hydrolase n=1 Tax=Alteromonas sp. V450 TaxID=1912139 RepID=UPI0008FF401F|nr:alpha/beta hydrolase [Alteromonas sp. V450]OJF69719.1 alpha/beta hydrolase [Alteromonas sp. V450]